MRTICWLILCFCFFLNACDTRETVLLREGNQLIQKVETFRGNKGYVPSSLSEMGIMEKEEGPLYYRKLSKFNYEIWFGTSQGESKTYYSDSRLWKEHQQ